MDFPLQFSGSSTGRPASAGGAFDMRSALSPRRLTIVMWDQAFLLRHAPGGSFADYDKVLDETIARGYNTLRLDPMPQLIDLGHPETVIAWPDPQAPYMPWGWNQAGAGPLGQWLIEFMEKVQRRRLNYTLSAWWFNAMSGHWNNLPSAARVPNNHAEGAEIWIAMLREWKRRFGFDGLVYVDLANEVPYFLPGSVERLKQVTGDDWSVPRFTPLQVAYLDTELNGAMAQLQREFPEVRFTASIHGDLRWLDVPLHFDCLDVHFYADVDPRWRERTRFAEYMPRLFTDASWHKEFSQRCAAAQRAVAPMLRAAQRSKLAAFAAWSEQTGQPLTTSESWASWYYFDSPDLDWGWLLEWAEWSVEDAIEYHMWGWTPHNYCQPQFANWQDALWHRRLTEKFLRG
jgi:hypothetical protein